MQPTDRCHRTENVTQPGHTVPRLRWRGGRPRDRGAARPRLRNVAGAATEERHASALELFFDMVFVVAVAELAAALLADPTPGGLVRYLALFVPVWWAWVGFTFYADRFDSDDAVHRVLMIGAMLAVVALATTFPQAFTEAGSARLVWGYVAVRGLLILLYVRAHRHLPAARALTGRYLVAFVAGAAVWAGSLLVAPPWRYAVWAVGMLLELLPPVVFSRAVTALPYHLSHIPERFGLFTIIVLGESVALGAVGAVGAIGGPGQAVTLGAGALWAGGLLVTAAQWWLYFDCLDHTPLRRWKLTGQTYLYGHLLIFAGITATGAGALLALRTATVPGSGEPDLVGHGGVADDLVPLGHAAAEVVSPSAAAWTLCGGVAAFLLGVGVIHYVATAPRGDAQAWSRLGLGAAVAGVAAFSARVPMLLLVGGLVAALGVQVSFELAVLARKQHRAAQEEARLRTAQPEPDGAA